MLELLPRQCFKLDPASLLACVAELGLKQLLLNVVCRGHGALRMVLMTQAKEVLPFFRSHGVQLGLERLWHETDVSLALSNVHGSAAEVPRMEMVPVMINLRVVQAELIELSRTFSVILLLNFDHLKWHFVADLGWFTGHAPSKRDLLRKVLGRLGIDL